MKVEIVDTTISHVDDIINIENLSFKIPWTRNAFLQELGNRSFTIYLSAKAGDRVVGYAGMWKIVDEGHITNIAVHPEFRGIGIGSMLLEALKKRAKKEGIVKMTLEVKKSNEAALKLYTKHGFIPAGIRKGYYAEDGEDAIIMWNEHL
ncbi:MAG: ribosomal protein S18-alanine N-acetyltransferase [Clostridiaceae bacterium]|nr:ribosomal protein S18-alanine N-acetyltransferase [Clostridiaceae bacterium]